MSVAQNQWSTTVYVTTGELPPLNWLEVLNPDIRLGLVRHALFDFDGTISVIRRGWETVMIPLMVEMICDGQPATPELVAEVEEYVDRSTGILTIKQMQWLEEAVVRRGIAESPRTAQQYKQIYNERLLRPVRQRMSQMETGTAARDHLMIAGARSFVEGLHDRHVSLYLASGTDHVYVLEEANALGVANLFGAHISGAQDDTEAYTKERIIARILDENHLSGEELVVLGDGPVEIRHAKARGAIALGVASDEEARFGLNPRKRERLLSAGADLIIADFTHHTELLSVLLDGRLPPAARVDTERR
ncbi:MAG: HAD family hydrolase [Chloroflexi bacterium]|nr:HAD family hydrolase [Chloroflexota bacterium]